MRLRRSSTRRRGGPARCGVAWRAFARWCVAALERKELPVALEIAERAKRRRFLAARPLGGRLLALRTILEAPDAALSHEAVLQRQQILASFPAYRASLEAGQKLV